MPSKTNSSSQALNQAYAALQRGDKREARHWAQIAASTEPNIEEPWLILGAASGSHASVRYLKRALKINPKSERARGGLKWASRRVDETAQKDGRRGEASSSQVKPPAQSKLVVQKRKPGVNVVRKVAPALRVTIPILVLTGALLLIAAWTFRPGMDSAGADMRENPASLQDGTLPSGPQADAALQIPAPMSTETNPPNASPSPTAFQPATLPSAYNPLTANADIFLNGLREGEFLAAQLPAGGEKLIVVSLREQRLYAYQGGTLGAVFVASTGGNHNTMTGNFHILDKIPNAYSDIWNFWMPNWMGIYYAGSLENGIHALPVLPNSETIWSDSLGTPVSYGCVVLGAQEAQALYDWAEVGTTVQINP
jgi:lipoprotein-anchoring transpeptidase ErfK/SrfK